VTNMNNNKNDFFIDLKGILFENEMQYNLLPIFNYLSWINQNRE